MNSLMSYYKRQTIVVQFEVRIFRLIYRWALLIWRDWCQMGRKYKYIINAFKSSASIN